MTEVELAKATVYGLGLGRRSRHARLTVSWTDRTPQGIVVKHELQRRTDHAGLEWREEEVVVVNPAETRDDVIVEPSYSEFPDDRVVCRWHDKAQRAYVAHESREGRSGWDEIRAWEIHPVTGVEQTAGEPVPDGGVTMPTCGTDGCDTESPGLDDAWEHDGTLRCADCWSYQERHGHWPDEDVKICVECRLDQGKVKHDCEESFADYVIVDEGGECPVCDIAVEGGEQ